MSATIPNDAATTASGSALAVAAGFYFSFRLVLPLLSTQLGMEASAGSVTGLGLGLLLFACICFDSPAAFRDVSSRLLLPGPNRWIFGFLLLSAVSLVWSDTSSIVTSLAYWSGLAADVAIVLLLLLRQSALEVSQALLKGFVWSACCLALLAWLMPAPEDLRLGDDLYFNANEIGNTCAFAVFFSQYLMRVSRGRWGFAAFFLTVTLVRSLSKTTLVAFLISQAVLLFSDRALSRKTKAALITLTVLLILAFWGLFEAYYDVYTTAGNQAETLTGRTAIWLYVLGAVFDQSWTLWIGHGFDAWWKVVPPFGSGLFEARHAENEILQQFYAFGVAGVVVLIGLYASLWQRLRKLRQWPARPLLLCLLLFIAVRGLAEADAFDLLLPLWCAVLLSAVAAERHVLQAAVPALPSQRFIDS
jgi:exopolysaccharide production protein ExoQ